LQVVTSALTCAYLTFWQKTDGEDLFWLTDTNLRDQTVTLITYGTKM